MDKTKKSPILKRVISLIFLLLWMGLIFFFSHQTATESSNVSHGLIELVVKFVMPNISQQALLGIRAAWNFLVRKFAHFSLYAVLGFFSFQAVITYEKIPLLLRAFLSFLIGAAYSVTDEYHQTFIEGRSGELRDVIIDSSGVLLAVLFCLAVYSLHRYIKNKRVGRMRKKQYIELTDTLQRELHKARLELDELREDKADLEKENNALNEELNALREKIAEIEGLLAEEAEDSVSQPEIQEISEEEPVVAEEIKLPEEIELPDDTAYGAKIIGKIVLSAAEYCNSLTANPAAENVKELVNLILGRSEVAKAEILKIVAAVADSQSKIYAMESELRECEDYFKSVMAQK